MTTTREGTTCRTIVELRGCRQSIYSTEDYADLVDRVQAARDATRRNLPAPLVQTSIRVRDGGVAIARPCSFDPTLVTAIDAVDDDA